MDKTFLKFVCGKTFLVTNDMSKVKKERNAYIMFFDKEKLSNYFEMNLQLKQGHCHCFYLRPNKLGIKNVTGKDDYFYVILCGGEDKDQCIRQKIQDKLTQEERDSDFLVLSEESNGAQRALDIETALCPTFMSYFQDAYYPIMYSPFGFHRIAFPQNKGAQTILSFGEERNFTLAYLEGNEIVISPSIERLENFYEIDQMDRLVNEVTGHLQLKNISLLMDYNSYSVVSNYLRRYQHMRKIPHTFSHLAATMFDNGFEKEKGIGVVYDSISYDETGGVLGSEVLYGSIGNYQPMGRWRPVPLPGGDIANIEPWRITLAIIKETLKGDFENIEIPMLKRIKENPNMHYILDAIQRGNMDYSLSSSMHHILSALGELLYYQETTLDFSFFENLFNDVDLTSEKMEDFYQIPILEEQDRFVIDSFSLFYKLISDIFVKESIEVLKVKTIHTLAHVTGEIVDKISKRTGERKVFLTGEFFKNISFLTIFHNELTSRGFTVYVNRLIPVDDSSISAGQILYQFYHRS